MINLYSELDDNATTHNRAYNREIFARDDVIKNGNEFDKTVR